MSFHLSTFIFTPIRLLDTYSLLLFFRYLHIHPYPLIRYTFNPTRLLDTHSTLPVYSFSWKIPTYPFISAYPFIKFDEKFQPACLLEPTRLLERWEYYYEFASEALHIVIFENFVKSMTSCLSKLKITPSFCFAFKIPDDVAASTYTSQFNGYNELFLDSV